MEAYRYASFEESARRLLTLAGGKAREVIQTSLDEAARIREAARQEGFEDGYREGIQRGVQIGVANASREAAAAVQLVDRVVKELETARDELVRAAESELVRLAVEIAGRIVRAEVTASHRIAQECLRRAIELTAGRQEISVRVHPDDLAALQQSAPTLHEATRMVADASVTRGGCVVQTRVGGVDADVRTQLDQIERALLGEK